MRILIAIMIIWYSVAVKAQEIWQLTPWPPDSNYVLGALPSGEPYWIHKNNLISPDSLYTSLDSILLKNGSGYALLGVDTVLRFEGFYETNYLYVLKNKHRDEVGFEIVDTDTHYSFEDHPDSLGFRVYERNFANFANPIYTHVIDTFEQIATKYDLTEISGGSGSTEYLDPYVIGSDTVGFILKNTQDTPDTVHIIGVVGTFTSESTTVSDTPTLDLTLTGTNISGVVPDGSITPAKLDRTYLTTESDPTIASQSGNSGKYLTTNGSVTSWATVINGTADSTNVVNSYGTIITESPTNTFNVKVDSSKFATQYDLTQVASTTHWASLNFGTSLYGNTQTFNADTYTTINYLASSESSSSIIDANHTNDEIEFVQSGTYRIDYKFNFIANADALLYARVYSSTLAAAIGSLTTETDSDSGFKNCHGSNSIIYTATAGEKIKLQLYPVGVTHTSVTIQSFFIVTKIN